MLGFLYRKPTSPRQEQPGICAETPVAQKLSILFRFTCKTRLTCWETFSVRIQVARLCTKTSIVRLLLVQPGFLHQKPASATSGDPAPKAGPAPEVGSVPRSSYIDYTGGPPSRYPHPSSLVPYYLEDEGMRRAWLYGTIPSIQAEEGRVRTWLLAASVSWYR